MADTGPIVTLPPDLISDIEMFSAPTNLWHMSRIKPLWPKVRGEGIKVAVLDTGMNSHDLLPEPIEARSFIQGESWRDGNGHGTHCAGTVLGREGIGLAPAASLIVGKVLSNGGSGSSQAIADGIRWAVDVGADIISMSLGSGSPYDPMQQALKYAWSKGVVITSAAGNAGFKGTVNTIGYPAKYLESLCIGASASNGDRASFSSGGRELDIVCPGQDIISCSTRNGYVSMSGTSMATPFSAGLLALIIELMRREGYPSWQNSDSIRSFFADNTEDKGTPGRDPYWGIGVPKYSDIVEKLDNATLIM
jgi:subtilisin family serine protease